MFVPMVLFGVAGSLLGAVVAAPLSVVLAAGIGQKIIRDEKKRQVAHRRQQAKLAGRRYVEEVGFIMNKESRDALRRTQRFLRDDFQLRAMTLHRSSTSALNAANWRPSPRSCGRWTPRWPSWCPPRRRGRDPVDDALTESVSELLRSAAARATGPEARAQLEELQRRLTGPLRVAVAGKVKAGECTRIVTWYARGEQPQVILHPRSGEPEIVFYTRDSGALDVDLGGREPGDIDRLEVSWPTSRLADLTLIDTPGIASISTDLSARTLRVLTPQDDRPPVVDAVLYLLRHTHASDIRFLESFHDDDLAHGTPMNAVGVLSRADEIGSCRLDALQIAERVSLR